METGNKTYKKQSVQEQNCHLSGIHKDRTMNILIKSAGTQKVFTYYHLSMRRIPDT